MAVIWALEVLLFSYLSLLITPTHAFLNATQDAHALVIANDRLYASVNKSTGVMDTLTLDGQNLLGTKEYNEVTPGGNAAGQNGIGPYLDCYCVPSGSYTPGKYATFKLYNGNDSTGVQYGGVVMSEVYPLTGQVLEQYWFLREGETGLHTFSRLAYYNETKPLLRSVYARTFLLVSLTDGVKETCRSLGPCSDRPHRCGPISLLTRRQMLHCHLRTH